MPIGIDDEGGVVMGVVVRAQPRPAVVARAGGERRLVERIDRGAVARAKADMAVERRAFGLVPNPELQRLLAERMRLGRAVARGILDIPAAAIAQRRERRVIKGAGAREITHTQRQMVEHARHPRKPPPPGKSAPMPWRMRPFCPSLFIFFIIVAMS